VPHGGIRDFVEFNQVYAEFFQPPLPARTTVHSWLGEGLKIEIDAIARIRNKGCRLC
jgi:2-iminobutanoate/2-iminopropanoate deaminase